MRSLFLNFWRHLLSDLGLDRSSPRAFRLDEELIWSLDELAEIERRSRDEVVADLLSYALAQRSAAEANLLRWQALSPREQQIVALVCLNFTNRQIASRLMISPETVKTHVRSVLHKFDVRSKTDLRVSLSDLDFSAWKNMDLN
jgi:DNA-binding CsgD family transcriptional regulator